MAGAWGIYHNHQPPAGAVYGDTPDLEIAYNHVYLIVTDQLHLGAPPSLGGPDSADSSDLVDPVTGAVHNANAALCLQPARIARGTIFVIGINCVTNGAVSQHPGFSSSYAAVAGGLYNAQIDLWADALLAYKAKGVAQVHALFQLEPSNTAQPGPKGSAPEYVQAFTVVWDRFQAKGVQAAGIRLGWDSDGANWRVPSRSSPEAFDWEPVVPYNLCSADFYPTKSPASLPPKGQTFSFGLGDNDGASPNTGFLHNAAVNHPGVPVLIRSMCPKMNGFGGDYTDASARTWFLDAQPQLLAIPNFMGVAWDHNNVQLDTVKTGAGGAIETSPNYTIVPLTKQAFHDMAPAWPTTLAGGVNVPPVHPLTVVAVASVKAPTILVNKSVIVTPAKVTTIAAVPAPSVVIPARPATVAAVVSVFAPTPGGGIQATPAVVAAIASVKAPTVIAAKAATATPATVVATALVPAPAVTLTGSVDAAPATVARAVVIPAPATHGAAVVTPSTVAATSTVPSSSVATVTTFPATVVAIGAVPLATVHATGRPTPATVARAVVIPAPTIGVGPRALPATVVAISSVPAPTVLRGTTALPTTAAAISSVPAPTIRRTAVATPSSVTAVSSVKAPSVVTNTVTNVVVLTVGAVAAVPTPAVLTVPTLVATEVAAASAVPAPSIHANATVFHPQFVKAVGRARPIGGPVTALAGATATPAAVAAIASVGAPVFTSAPTPTPGTLAALAAVPSVSLTADSAVSVGTVSVSASVPAVAAGTTTVATPATVAAIGTVVDPSQVKGSSRPHAPVVPTVAAVPAPTITRSAEVPAPLVAVAARIISPGLIVGGESKAAPIPVDLAVVIPDVDITTSALVEGTSVDAIVDVQGELVADAVAEPSAVAAFVTVNSSDFEAETTVFPDSVDAIAAVPDPSVFEVFDVVVAVDVVVAAVVIFDQIVTVGAIASPAVVAAIGAVLFKHIHIVRHVDALYAQVLSSNDPYGNFSTNDPYEDIERRTA